MRLPGASRTSSMGLSSGEYAGHYSMAADIIIYRDERITKCANEAM